MCSKDWLIFENLDQWGSEGFCSCKFSEYFKSAREAFHFKLSGEQSLRKVAESLYIILTALDEIRCNYKA